MDNRMEAATKTTDALPNRFRNFINQEIHIKLEGDESAVAYTLREIQEDFLVVDYGESQRFIPTQKIVFLQIGSYPKE